MKKEVFIGLILLGIAVLYLMTKQGQSGNHVRAKYTGPTGIDLSGADMVLSLKYGEILEGDITPGGLAITRAGGIAGITPETIPTGQFEIINIIS